MWFSCFLSTFPRLTLILREELTGIGLRDNRIFCSPTLIKYLHKKVMFIARSVKEGNNERLRKMLSAFFRKNDFNCFGTNNKRLKKNVCGNPNDSFMFWCVIYNTDQQMIRNTQFYCNFIAILPSTVWQIIWNFHWEVKIPWNWQFTKLVKDPAFTRAAFFIAFLSTKVRNIFLWITWSLWTQ